VKSVLPDDDPKMSNRYDIVAKNTPPEDIMECSDEANLPPVIDENDYKTRVTEEECKANKNKKWVKVKVQGVCNFKDNLPKAGKDALNTPKACFDWAYYNTHEKKEKDAIEKETEALREKHGEVWTWDYRILKQHKDDVYNSSFNHWLTYTIS
jgi:hypothetical protein